PIDPKLGPDNAALATLRRYARPQDEYERCELCSARLGDHHHHLVDPSTQRVSCTCEACALLFSDSSSSKFRRVPRRVRLLTDFQLTDVQWMSLNIPINLAYFLKRSSVGRVVAYYPSPGGAIEAVPPPDAWEAVLQRSPSVQALEPDVEALLVNRLGTEL